MRRTRRLPHVLAAVAFSCAVAGSATPSHAAGVDPSAATPVQREQAQARFLRGRQLYDAKSYDAALAEFRASHEIVASPNSRLYVARALRELGRPVEAYVELGRTEVEARELTRADNRYQKAADAATDERAALRKALGFVTVKLTNANDTTRLYAAGEEIRRGGFSEPIPVKPGTTEIRVETAGYKPASRSVTLDAGATMSLDIDAASEATAVASAPPPPPPPKPEPETPRGSLRPYAYAAGGVAVLGLATFTVFGLMAKGTHDDLSSRCLGGGCPTDPSDDASAGRTQQTVANVGLVAFGIGAAGFIALLVAEPKRTSPAASVTPVIGLGRVGVSGRF